MRSTTALPMPPRSALSRSAPLRSAPFLASASSSEATRAFAKGSSAGTDRRGEWLARLARFHSVLGVTVGPSAAFEKDCKFSSYHNCPAICIICNDALKPADV